MKAPLSIMNGFMVLILLALFIACDKNDDPVNDLDPSNLVVEIVSIDHENGDVIIKATADNATQYHLYIEGSSDAEEVNTTGRFEYTFDGEGKYDIEVRAYGASGKYVKVSKVITISTGEVTPIPVDSGYFTPLQYDGYTLVWQEEFSGSSINSANWSFEIGDGCPNLCGWGNNELEYYRTENAWVGGDVLTIEAREESFGGRQYTSARMISRNKQKFQYGRIDIRALLPKGQGIWPALWMLGNNMSAVGWPQCGEIDIMELIGGNSGDRTCYGTVHWHDGNGHASYGDSYTLPSGTFADEYHVFTITWDESSIKWFMNDILYNQVNITGADMSEFHQEFWFILNVAVGGNWPGNPDASTVFPQQMRVDYIRVFQQD